MSSIRKSHVIAFSAAWLLSACWEPTELDVQRVVPGVIALPGAQAVAVGEVVGPEGERVSHALAEGLMAQNRFTVLDWSSPHGMGQYGGGWADTEGGWQTADAAILGSVRSPQLVAEDEARGANTMDGAQVTTYSRTWHMSVTGSFRVVDPHNGRILTSTAVTGERHSPQEHRTVLGDPAQHDGAYLDSLFGPAPFEVLQELALGALADELLELVAVTYEPARVVLFHDARAAEFKDVVHQATLGHWRPAIEVYGKAVLEYEEHAPHHAYMAHHNYGVALACDGDLEAGIKELQLAYSMHKHKATAQTLKQMQSYQRAALNADSDGHGEADAKMRVKQ